MKKNHVLVLNCVLLLFAAMQLKAQFGPEVVIGQTFYDLQTNGSMGTRIINHGDGTLSTTWTFSGEPGVPWSDRGMAYHFFDGTNWVSNPNYQDANNILRIEPVRTGFGSIGRVAGVGDIIVAHQTAVGALQVNINPNTNATQAWSSTAVTSMPLIWARIATGGPDGKTVHAIGLTEPSGGTFTGTPFNGISGAMLYNRSTDGGNTWNTTMVALPGIDSTIFSSMSGDNYAIDAKGNTVAIVAGESNSRVMLWKSTDNGLTWDTTQIMSFPYEPWDDSQITDLDGDGDVDSFLVNGVYQREAITVSDGSYSVLIDNNNKAHVWFGKMQMSNDSIGDDSYSYYPTSSGIFYWNEDFDTDSLNVAADLVDDNGDGAFNVYTNYADVGATAGPTPYGAGLTTFPSAGIDAAGNLYLIYSGAKEGLQYSSDGTEPSRKHIYAVKSTDEGATWTSPIDLVGDESAGFDQIKEYAYPSLAKNVDGYLHLIYQSDIFPGSGVTINNTTFHPFDLPSDIVYLKVPNTLVPINLGSIAGSGIVNGNPNAISITVSPTGCPSFSYQWYSFNGITSAPSGSSTSGWTLLPGATSTSYDPPALFQSKSFACFVTTSSGCGTSGWAQGVATFTYTFSVGSVNYLGQTSGTALNPDAISFNNLPVGCPSFSYQWYSFNDITSAPTGSSTSGWTLIPGATASSYDPPTLFQSTTFACFVTPSAGCGTAGWAQGAASFTITSSAGQVNSASVQQCGNSPVALSFVSAPNGLGNAAYQWYVQSDNVACPEGNSTLGWQILSGANTANATFNPAGNGNYTLACLVIPEAISGLPAQWANGCKLVQVSSYTAQSIIGNPNITPFSPYTYLVNQIPGNTYTWQVTGGAISSGQGSNQVVVIWASTGPYLLQLIESNGICSDTTSLNIVSSSCALTVNAVAINPTTFCNGQTASLVANAAGNVTYQWQLNGAVIPGASNDTLVADQSGSYQVVATLDANCSAISLPLSITELPELIPPGISLSGNSGNCNSAPATLTASGNFSSFVWSTGANGASIEVSTSDTYSVTGYDAYNCSAQSAPQDINLALLPPVNVCVVSVDSLTGRNIVVWEKPQTSLIDSFVVFRESVVADVYEAIGTQAFADFSTFIDPIANPLVQATRYKLGLIDTCGTLSTTSPYHKTIHLTLNLGLGGAVNLIWSGYEGLSFGSYKIYRGTAPDAMTELVTIQSNLSSYTDLTPPAGTVYYQIGIVVPLCNPTAFGFAQSRSNVANTGSIGFGEIGAEQVRVFPNPSRGQITIESTSNAIGLFSISDISGRVCLSGKLIGQSTAVSVENLPAGVYVLQFDEKPEWRKKIIKQ